MVGVAREYTKTTPAAHADMSLAGGKVFGHPGIDQGFLKMLSAQTHLVVAAPNSTMEISSGSPVSRGLAANDMN